MTDLALDPATNDLAVTDGDLALVHGVADVRQRVVLALRKLAGEWYLDRTEGIPYLEAVLVRDPNVAAIDAIFRAEIASVHGVLAITSFASTYDAAARSYSFEFTALSTDGEFTVSATAGSDGDVLGILGA